MPYLSDELARFRRSRLELAASLVQMRLLRTECRVLREQMATLMKQASFLASQPIVSGWDVRDDNVKPTVLVIPAVQEWAPAATHRRVRRSQRVLQH